MTDELLWRWLRSKRSVDEAEACLLEHAQWRIGLAQITEVMNFSGSMQCRLLLMMKRLSSENGGDLLALASVKIHARMAYLHVHLQPGTESAINIPAANLHEMSEKESKIECRKISREVRGT